MKSILFKSARLVQMKIWAFLNIAVPSVPIESVSIAMRCSKKGAETLGRCPYTDILICGILLTRNPDPEPFKPPNNPMLTLGPDREQALQP